MCVCVWCECGFDIWMYVSDVNVSLISGCECVVLMCVVSRCVFDCMVWMGVWSPDVCVVWMCVCVCDIWDACVCDIWDVCGMWYAVGGVW